MIQEKTTITSSASKTFETRKNNMVFKNTRRSRELPKPPSSAIKKPKAKELTTRTSRNQSSAKKIYNSKKRSVSKDKRKTSKQRPMSLS